MSLHKHTRSKGLIGTRVPWCLGDKVGQIKIMASEDTIDKFKRIVLAKHGKLELSAEGEEALRLHMKKYERLLGG